MPFLDNIERFSLDFKNILITMKDICDKRELTKEKLAHVKTQYNNMVKTNNKKIFLYCLDSFFYQYKNYSLELEQIESSRKMVNNRMYCEYYKLYKIIVDYLGEIRVSYESKHAYLKPFPPYKDLETTVEYELTDIENIYSNVVLLLNHLHQHATKNDVEIDGYRMEFSISNFVHTLKNENLILQGQIDLFMNYISFFLVSQKKQYDRICSRITCFLEEIDYEPPGTEEVFFVIEEEKKEKAEAEADSVVTAPIVTVEDSPRLEMSFE